MSWYSPEVALRLGQAAVRGLGTTGSYYKLGTPQPVYQKGMSLLQNSHHNKGTCFTLAERERLGLRGLLPPKMSTLEDQHEKDLRYFKKMQQDGVAPILIWKWLEEIKTRNSHLYYKLLMEDINIMAPIVYTPTVGEVCQKWHKLWRRSQEMYFTPMDQGEMSSIIHNWPQDHVDLVVVTDGSRILGLGDLGANGVGITLGKLDLYVAGGGVDPERTLPVVLDTGVNNAKLREHPDYLGTPIERLDDEAFDEMVEEFMGAVTSRWKHAMIHFEDFATPKARRILSKYRDTHFCWNDDIQGSAAVSVAATLASLRKNKIDYKDIKSMGGLSVVCCGAGSAAIGVLDMIKQTMGRFGVPEEQQLSKMALLDSKGLVGGGREGISGEKVTYQRNDLPDKAALLEVVKAVKPQILIGCSSTPGLFSKEVLEEVAKHCESPLIFPLSNPTSKAECTAEEAFAATGGRCLFASGSPFDDVDLGGGKTGYSNQCNNYFIFPGLGVGSFLSGANRVNDEMLFAAAHAVSQYVSEEDLEQGIILPRVNNIRDCSAKVAAAVGLAAMETGVAHGGIRGISWSSPTLSEDMKKFMWTPTYAPFLDMTWKRTL